MEFSIKTIILFSAVILTGLSAGLFYAWQVSVIPGTKHVPNLTYLETMQSINRAILNPAFFLIFFGPLLLLGIAGIYAFHPSKLVFALLLVAFMSYLGGTFGVTVLGNVPLNNKLDALNLADLQTAKLAEFRSYYEPNWNKLHLIRTAFSALSFLFSLAAVFAQLKNF